MKTFLKTFTAVLVCLFVLASCKDSVDSGEVLLSCPLPLIPDSKGTSCVSPPPIDCPAPTVPNETNDACLVGVDPDAPEPSVMASEGEAILFYNRIQDGTTDEASYDGYKLHAWNNESCHSLADESVAVSWANGLPITGFDENYGAYWILKLNEHPNDCVNFIIHIGTEDSGKELGGGDMKMKLVEGVESFHRMNWTISGYPEVFEHPITSLGDLPLSINDFKAHWIDETTIVLDIDPSSFSDIRLHYAYDASLVVDSDNKLNGMSYSLTATELTDEQKQSAPMVSGWPAFSGEWSSDDARNLIKSQLVVAAYDGNENAFFATYVQTAKVIDALFTKGEQDANEETLGVHYGENDNKNENVENAISVSVWAPTAQNVRLRIYNAERELQNTQQMTENPTTGVWSFEGGDELDRLYYRFELSVYHPQSQAIEVIETSDPYSVSLGVNGVYSQFVNLNDNDLMPEGWIDQEVPIINQFEDAVIYEGHVRDFSAMDDSVSIEKRGKYLAFTETTSRPMQHLIQLVEAGLTHFHLLPINDIASINEAESRIVDITHTVGELCEKNSDAPVCGEEDNNATLLSVLESYSPLSEDAQALVNSMRSYDSFNWGYDPKHFNVPDGIYATDPNSVARIFEFRSMVKALHDIGLRVIIDVVYNHTNSAGLWEHSVLDKVVPGYYHSRDIRTGDVIQDTCCNDTALEHAMMDKLMSDSLALWAKQYSIDGFRFDIMSHGSKQQMLDVRERIQQVDSDTYFYGEGWGRADRGFEQADQFNMAGTEIATFNDRLRDGVRHAALFNGESNASSLNQQDIIKLGMAGTLANYVLKGATGVASKGSQFNPSAYALDPADIINYVSKHDDNSLWDQLQFTLSFNMPLSDRVRSSNIAAAIPLISQGIPFFQMGGDMLRSKSLDRNTYDAGDWFNRVDFTMTRNNWNAGLPLEQDNGWRWYTDSTQPEQLSITALASSPYTQVGATDIQFAHAVFKEFLSIRRDSPLFRLTTESAIKERVGFHNLGVNQTQGVIVMSIDDGIGFSDLDPANDAIVVMINGTDIEQSHTISTASHFGLHPTLMTSIDTQVSMSTFSENGDENTGTFTVPAKTMAVFVKKQGETQGEGLSAFATAGAPEVVPYGSTEILIRGDMNGWGTNDPLVYLGSGVYRTSISLTADTTYGFKLASEDWSTVDFGSVDAAVVEGNDKTLSRGASNLSFTTNASGEYFFEVNANEPENPVIHVRRADAYSNTSIYVRGGINGWGTESELIYIGEGIYQVTIDVSDTGEQEFKIASDDWSTVDLSFGDGSNQIEEDETKLLGSGAGIGNLVMNFTSIGEYVFIFNASHRSERTLSVHQMKMFGDTPVFVRGSMNGWGTTNELLYLGNSRYQVDIALVAGNVEFKLASSDWSTIDLGAEGEGQQVILGDEKQLAPVGSNLILTVPNEGTYRFIIDGPNESYPIIIITEL